MSTQLFFSDTPIRTLEEGRLLWGDDQSVLKSVVDISSEILYQEAGITYAIYGSWGSGKTSFMRMIEDQVQVKLKDVPPGTRPVIFSWYNASAYQHNENAMATLSLRVWRDLARKDGDARGAIDVYRLYYQALFRQDPMNLVETEAAGPQYFAMLEALAQRMGEIAEFPLILENELNGKGVTGGSPRKLVLIIDDLDRCAPQFIAQLLQALRRLSDIENLFVFMLSDRERILSGVRKMYPEAEKSPQEADRALEKYVNYSVNLPSMDEKLLTDYIRRLTDKVIEQYGLPSDNVEYRVLEDIRELADYIWAGVRIKTPRAVKRTINHIRPRFRLMEGGVDTALVNRDRPKAQFQIKRALLEYVYPEFFNRFVRKAEQPAQTPERVFLLQLERACQELFKTEASSAEDVRDRRANFDSRVTRYRTAHLPTNETKFDIPTELAQLLAKEPLFAKATADIYYAEKEVDDFKGKTLSGDIPRDRTLNLAEEFTRFYLLSEQGDAREDAEQSLQGAMAAYQLINENRDAFGPGYAAQLGNLGINAEKFGHYRLAEDIFLLARELNPNHVGVMQQYASFILDRRPAEELDKAAAILDRLRQPPFNNENYSRTLALYAQLHAKRNIPLNEETITELVSLAMSETNFRRIGAIITSLCDAGNVSTGLDIYQRIRSRSVGQERCIELKRYLADALARRQEVQYENIAMDLYHQMLTDGEVPLTEIPDVQHNLATLYYKHDYDREAGELWFHVYNARPTDGAIRRAYSTYLIRAGALDEASMVMNSEPVSEMKLYSSTKVLPERFSDFDIQPCRGDSTTELMASNT